MMRLLALALWLLPSLAFGQCVFGPGPPSIIGIPCPMISDAGGPSLTLDFTAGTMPAGITFTRASGATYFDVTGTMQTAATNVPRLDYDPVTHAPRGLLIEEARTNLLTNSQAINSWPTKTDATVVDNSTTSPDGTVNASLVTEGVAGTAVVTSNAAAIAGSSVMSFSVFLKRGNTDILRLLAADAASTNGVQTWANLATGTVASTGLRGAATTASAAIQAIGNGWYRVTLSCTMAAGSTTAAVLVNSALSNGNGTRVSGATFYAWGADIQVGAFPTSYIPTAGAAATRAAEVATMPVGPWFNPAQGTLVVDAMMPFGNPILGVTAILSDGTGNNRLQQGVTGGTAKPSTTLSSGGVNSLASAENSVMTFGTPYKFGTSIIAGQFLSALNGAVDLSSTTGIVMPVGINTLGFGRFVSGGFFLNGWISRTRYWNTAHSATQLPADTQ